MQYQKIRIRCSDAPERLYRIVLVKEDMDLLRFAGGIMTLFQAIAGHMYEFKDQNSRYVLRELMEEYEPDKSVVMEEYQVKDLSQKFLFSYDYGECWDFDCFKFKKPVEMTSDQEMILIEGAGRGIWEDNRHGFNKFCSGEADPELTDDDWENDMFMPWNFHLNKLKDFDKPLDIELFNMYLEDYLKNGDSDEWDELDEPDEPNEFDVMLENTMNQLSDSLFSQAVNAFYNQPEAAQLEDIFAALALKLCANLPVILAKINKSKDNPQYLVSEGKEGRFLAVFTSPFLVDTDRNLEPAEVGFRELVETDVFADVDGLIIDPDHKKDKNRENIIVYQEVVYHLAEYAEIREMNRLNDEWDGYDL